MRLALPAALVAAVLTLTACDSGAEAPGASSVEVDTPELVKAKEQTDVPDCAPGDATDGGLPDLTLPCLGGGTEVDLTSLQGPMIINLWQAFCGPCRKEMPALQDFHEQYGDQVPVLGIDYQDTQPAAALDLAKKSGVTYPLLADPGGDLNAADPLPVIRGLPYLLFLDEDGELSIEAGGIESADELVDLVGEHLGVDL
ncbi:TlpA disulfide reductase family protein [Nocardioides sp. SR21]|uniref:TlpA family protein disulfide reductase n=1 Tax=Nocardioides sp. SR21 TaxID=2919501 RepID=UPI001FA94A4D|nr:TlpA disulfide reductase family protein [Nocardioides sp. SR21]